MGQTSTVNVKAADWPHWRGPDRNDIIKESALPDSPVWKTASHIWNVNVGEGGSSPIIIDGRMYVMGWKDGRDTVSCLDVRSGREIWKHSYPCPKHARHATGDEGLYSGPTATPEFDISTKRLYTLSADGDLKCWETSGSARIVWSLNLYTNYDVAQRPRHGRSGRRDYGYTAAPLIHGDWVIVEAGAKAGTLIAFDKLTGKQAWTSACTAPAGHTGGIVQIDVAGVPCAAVLNYEGLLVTRLDKKHAGETLAEYPWSTDFANNIATPAVYKNSVVITSEYNRKAICRIDISLEGARRVWEQPFSSKVCSPIIHDGHIYWAWRQAYCLDFETGQVKWSGGSFGDAGSCLITDDQKLIIWGAQGTLVLAETAHASPSKYHQLSQRISLAKSDVWPHIAVSEGRLFCKDREGNILAFDLRQTRLN